MRPREPTAAFNGNGVRAQPALQRDTVTDQLSGLQVKHAIHQFGERDLNRGTRFPQQGKIALRDFIGPPQLQ